MSDPVPVIRPDPRITRRRKAIERSRKKRLFVALACLGAVLLVVWIAFWSPLLTVRTVRVIGSRHLTGADIERAAHIGSGTNLLLLSTAAVVRDTETLPWVRRARVDRSLPGTVRVRVVERKPVVVLAIASTRWLVDQAGHVIARAAGRHHDLPTLAGIHLPHVHPGMRLAAASGRGALEAWRALPHKVRHRVVAVFAPTVAAITFTLRDGITVRYGPPTERRDKNQVLMALLRRVSGSGASYVDVRVPTSPAVGPVPGATPAPATTPSPPIAAPSPSASSTPKPSPKSSPTP